jgi:lipopolysaccharide biosynthesis regulator YciM
VRALLLRASAYQYAGEFQAAIETYESLGRHSQRLIPGIREELQSCYDNLPDSEPASACRGDTVAGTTDNGDGEGVTRFRCEECGFSSRKLFWQCPGCRSWSSVKPLPRGDIE